MGTILSYVSWIIHAHPHPFLFFSKFLWNTADGRNHRGRTIKADSCFWPPRRWCARPLCARTVRACTSMTSADHNFSSALLSSGCRFAARSRWLPSFSYLVSLLEVWAHRSPPPRTCCAGVLQLVASNAPLFYGFFLHANQWLRSKVTLMTG